MLWDCLLTSGFCVLSTHSQSPEMSQTTVCPNLFQSLQIISQLRVNRVRQNLIIFAIDDIFLSVQEPGGDLELRGVLDDGHDTLKFIRVELASAAGL